MADNFYFDICCAPLDESLAIAFHGASGGKATHWRVDAAADRETRPARPRMVLAWHEAPGFTPFPSPIDQEAATQVVKDWLAAQDYGHEPDHGGDNGKSWRVYNESWAHVGNCFYAFVAIEPLWALYGK